MKLNIVPARTGIQWVKLGIRTFFRQPLALSGLFFMFLAVMSLVGMIPVIGLALALALLPACTLGLMAASKEAATGKFPMPTVFISAFRAGRQQLRAMLAFMALQLPLSLMFWHAPALVHWHQVPPVKSVFFSLVACLRNFWAFTLYGLVWMALLIVLVLAISVLATLANNAQLAQLVLLPCSMLIAAMFFTSTYFTFRDCFDTSALQP